MADFQVKYLSILSFKQILPLITEAYQSNNHLSNVGCN